MTNPNGTDNLFLNQAFVALSDSMRREIVELIIQHTETTVNDLCAHFPVSRFVVMRHLNILEEAQLLTRKRVGNSKILHIDQNILTQLTTGWLADMANRKTNNDQ